MAASTPFLTYPDHFLCSTEGVAVLTDYSTKARWRDAQLRDALACMITIFLRQYREETLGTAMSGGFRRSYPRPQACREKILRTGP